MAHRCRGRFAAASCAPKSSSGRPATLGWPLKIAHRADVAHHVLPLPLSRRLPCHPVGSQRTIEWRLSVQLPILIRSKEIRFKGKF